jgi:thiosulfate/3-mercaptopyruvate sulfurtransferase
MNTRPLVSVDWLHDHLENATVSIIDASWHMPASGRDARAEYVAGHIPGAVLFDIDAHSGPSHLPHMMPAPESFARAVGDMGISHEDQIVVYDSLGLFSAARVWWMFRYFGARQVFVLDGGLPAWQRAGYALKTGNSHVEAMDFKVGDSSCVIADASDVLRACRNGDRQILDARSEARFFGREPEPRQGLRSGHVPGSRCLPFVDLIDNGYLKSNDQLRELLAARGITDDSRVITTCGSGVTAAIISLALECIGVTDVALYDGSWSEWGALDDLPVVTG